MARFLRRVLGHAHARHFREAVRAAWNVAVVDGLGVVAGDFLHASDAFCRGHVGQCRTRHAISDGVVTWDVGGVVVVDHDLAAVVHDAALLEADVLDVGHHARRAQHDVALEGFFALFGLYGDFAAAAGRVHASDLGTGLDLDARLLEGALKLLGDFLVLHRHNAVDVLHHGHFRADGVVEVGKLDADRARADDDHFLGLLLEGHRLAVANHLFTVLRERRQLA